MNSTIDEDADKQVDKLFQTAYKKEKRSPMTMKWHYDKHFKQWSTDKWIIGKDVANKEQPYSLELAMDDFISIRKYIGNFRKLSSAKQVAELIEEG